MHDIFFCEKIMNLMESLDLKIQEGQVLQSRLDTFKIIPGVEKLSRKIRKELQFLQNFKANPDKLKIEHLQCSNLLHLSAIVQALGDCSDPYQVLKSYSGPRKITVDIVAQKGAEWIKVIARSPQALEKLSTGDQAYGQKSLIDQAQDYINAAEENLYHFKPPSLVFVFHAGVPEKAHNKLTGLGIKVIGDVVPMTSMDSDEDIDDLDVNDENINDGQETLGQVDHHTLNLDITAMVAYVSALTNGHTQYEFQEFLMNQQAGWERSKPAKPLLDALFNDKSLITCQSAINDFQAILSTLGGPGEKIRAEKFLERVKVVPDQISDKVKNLKCGGKVRERSKVIFGTGDALKVVTVSANTGFVRAAQSQNIDLAVISHEPRALTEDKMKTARKIE